jgi:hypothetical protein
LIDAFAVVEKMIELSGSGDHWEFATPVTRRAEIVV